MRVSPAAVPAGDQDGQRAEADHDPARHALPLRDLPAIALIGALAPVAGIGLLYLLRGAHVAAVGPAPAGALPLEQLARADAQPLARMALAWLPAGLAAGALAVALTRSALWLAATAITFVAAAVLIISTAVSDAVENNEAIAGQVGAALHAPGPWVSVALLLIGVVAGARLAAAMLRAPSGA